MNKQFLLADFMLLLTAMIWGLAFSFQKSAMDHLDPFIFTALRYFAGAVTVAPFFFFFVVKKKLFQTTNRTLLRACLQGFALSLLLFLGTAGQQIGLLFTSAGNSGFITTTYVIIIPILLFFFKHKVAKMVWAAAFLALVGMVLMSWNGTLVNQWGDLLQLMCAFFWALHILAIGFFVRHSPVMMLAFWQTLFCALWSLAMALIVQEPWPTMEQIVVTKEAIFFTGVLSIGVAFTMQSFAQKRTLSTHASTILSTEAIFAAFFGWLLLAEEFGWLKLSGACFILGAIFLSQWSHRTLKK